MSVSLGQAPEAETESFGMLQNMYLFCGLVGCVCDLV